MQQPFVQLPGQAYRPVRSSTPSSPQYSSFGGESVFDRLDQADSLMEVCILCARHTRTTTFGTPPPPPTNFVWIKTHPLLESLEE